MQAAVKPLGSVVLQFQMRRSYGRNRYYPLNATASVIVVLADRVCFDSLALQDLEAAGFLIEITHTEEAP